jgi:hypothetical protein
MVVRRGAASVKKAEPALLRKIYSERDKKSL